MLLEFMQTVLFSGIRLNQKGEMGNLWMNDIIGMWSAKDENSQNNRRTFVREKTTMLGKMNYEYMVH